MQYEKVIDGTIDIHNPINFCADKTRYLFAEIKSKFIGKCFKGVYIVSIKSVLDCSACHIIRTNSTGEGYVDVRFVASVVSYNRWDIITGIEVVSRQQLVIGTTDRAVVSVLASKAAETLAIGQKIAIRTVLAQHAPQQTKISVVGTLLTCDQAAPTYRLRGTLDHNAKIELEPMFRAIEAELQLREKLNTTFFEQLLYSYRKKSAASGDTIKTWPGGPVWVGPSSVSHVGEVKNVLEIVHRVINDESVPIMGSWTRALSIHRSSPLVMLVEPSDTDIEGSVRVVFAEFLKNILDFLVAARELAAVYNTQELIDKHLNIWSVMRNAQKLID
jgi:hypothetical protein